METAADYQKAVYDRQDYGDFLSSIQANFDAHGGPFFTTDASGLFDLFLMGFQEGETRQHYTCHACRKFVEHFGGLVTISPDGTTIPVMWPEDAPGFYQVSVDACRRVVEKAKVTGVFLSSLSVWGQPVTGEWHHMHVKQNGFTFNNLIQTAHQVMAEKKQEYALVSRSLDKYDVSVIDQAITLLETESLAREEKSLASARWFRELIEVRRGIRGKRRQNIVWLAVATAPAGWAHIKNNMFGTLLQDIDDGYSFAQIKRKFTDKMHPLRYQRPQAPPSKGNILQANKIVDALQSAGALQRRFATFDEVRDRMIWLPDRARDQSPQGDTGGGGPFDRLLRDQHSLASHVPSKNITWAKFRDTVLDKARSIQFYTVHGNYSAITTCISSDAPPILQWDFEDNRNPFAQYVYHGGSSPTRWSLPSHSWVDVIGVCYQSSQWTSDLEHHGQSVIFILRDCHDTNGVDLAIFPETLKAEYREIRKTIEQFSKTGRMTDTDGQLASGIRLGKRAAGLTFRVRVGSVTIDYKIDRWD